MSATTFSIEIPTEEPMVHTEYQYGMRYPNGHVTWNVDNAQIPFRLLATNDVQRAHWEEKLLFRAGHALADADAYIAGHQLIRRQVVVAVTAPEDVK